MSKKFGIVLLVVLIFTLGLTACERSASTTSQVSTTPTGPAVPTAIKSTPLENPTKGTAEVAGAIPTAASQTEPATGTQPTVSAPTATKMPTAVPGTPGPIPTLTKPATYTLQQGEWPICIARRFDVDHTALLSLNNLAMNYIPPVGFVLQIPTTGSWSYGERARFAHPTNYTVKEGDTIYTTACYYGDVSPEGIIAANGLSAPYTLTPGQTIKIP